MIHHTENTERVLYLDWYRQKYYCRSLSSRASCICMIHTEITARVLYLDWYRQKYYCRTLSSRASCICIIHTENTERVLYLDWYRHKYYCRTLSSRASCICTIHTKNTSSVVSGLIQTKSFTVVHWVLERVLSERYTLRIQRECCIWIDKDIKELVGGRHLVQFYKIR